MGGLILGDEFSLGEMSNSQQNKKQSNQKHNKTKQNRRHDATLQYVISPQVLAIALSSAKF